MHILSGLFRAENHEMSVQGEIEFQCRADHFHGNYVVTVNSSTLTTSIDLQNIQNR